MDPDKVRGISSMPEPRNIEELRRFLGMINYVAKVLPSLAYATTQLATKGCPVDVVRITEESSKGGKATDNGKPHTTVLRPDKAPSA